jgi:cytochrome P450
MKIERRLPPGPRGLPLLGSGPAVIRDPLRFYRHMTLDYGDLSHARIGPTSFYLVNESPLIEQFLVGQHKDCVKDATTRSLYPLVGHGLLTSEGELWKRQRKLSGPAFAPKRITAYADVMVESAERSFRSFRDGEARDFHADIMSLTLEIVGKTILGVNTREEADRIAGVTDAAFAYFEERLYSWKRLLPFDLPSPSLRRFRKAKAELDEIVRSIVARSRDDREQGDHLIARLSRARSEEGEAMSEQQLHDEAVTMLLAGHETTALALMYGVYCLSTQPGAAARLREEVDKELGGRPVTFADLPRLRYLDACARETLRLYPPAYAFGREVVKPFELAGYTIPVGSQVVVSPYGMHRNPRHFPEPESFRPERWLEGSSSALPRFAYLPFGGGPRVCIGSHFAMMELCLVLATLVQQLELEVLPGFDLHLSPVITLRSRGGLPVRVRRREQPRSPARDESESTTPRA